MKNVKMYSILLTLTLLVPPFCKADQLAYITKDQAQQATIFLREKKEVLLWCACCEGNNPKQIISVSNVYFEPAGYEQFYKVVLEGTDNKGQKKKEDLDLAYVFFHTGTKANCVGKSLGFQCDPCTETFDWPIGQNEDNASDTAQAVTITFKLPNGYQTKDANGLAGSRNDNDFDNDGFTDLAIVCYKVDGSDPIVVVYLSSKYLVSGTYSWFPWEHMVNDFEYKNNVLTLTGSDMGRAFTGLKLKYYSALNNMKLIGYDETNLGVNGNGEYEKSINLLTGEYVIDGVMRKINIDLITLSNIENYLDFLRQVGSEYIGK